MVISDQIIRPNKKLMYNTARTIFNDSVQDKAKSIMLTEKEVLILDLISRDLSNKEIGKKLFLSHHTIHTYRNKLMSKLDVTKSTGLVRRGFELGFLSIGIAD